MQRPSTLFVRQLQEFIKGFNQLIEGGDQNTRVGTYKHDGLEFARTLVLHHQVRGGINSHAHIGTVAVDTNFVKLEKDWLVAAEFFKYADILE